MVYSKLRRPRSKIQYLLEELAFKGISSGEKLGLSFDKILKIIKAVEKRKTRFIDVGVAKITKEKKTKTRFFLGYSGVGFDVFMLKKIQPYKKFGPLSYLICAIINFYKFKNIEMLIKK